MAESFNPSYVELRREIVSKVPATARTILDVGAADGTLGAHLLAQAPEERYVVGIEANPQLAEAAALRLTDVVCADVETLDWSTVGPGQTFDCIVLADVLEHLRDPFTTLRHATTLLAHGGSIVLSLPNVRHISAAWTIYGTGTFPRHDRGLFDRTHLRWFTPRDAFHLCESTGLDVTHVEYRLRLLDRPGGVLNSVVERLRWLSAVPFVRDLLAYQLVLTARPRTYPGRAH